MPTLFSRSLLLGLLLLTFSTACQKVPVGYLDTTYASFPQREVQVYREVSDDDPHSKTRQYPAPWTSQRIQGVSGTNPVNFAYAGVTVQGGGDATRFAQLVDQGLITVTGGTINLFPAAVDQLPNGRYTIHLHVYNEGYSRELSGLCTFIISDRAQ